MIHTTTLTPENSIMQGENNNNNYMNTTYWSDRQTAVHHLKAPYGVLLTTDFSLLIYSLFCSTLVQVLSTSFSCMQNPRSALSLREREREREREKDTRLPYFILPRISPTLSQPAAPNNAHTSTLHTLPHAPPPTTHHPPPTTHLQPASCILHSIPFLPSTSASIQLGSRLLTGLHAGHGRQASLYLAGRVMYAVCRNIIIQSAFRLSSTTVVSF